MQNNPMGAAPGVAPSNPSAVSFQSDPNMRQQFKGFMSGLSKRMEQQQPVMQAPLPMPAPMQGVDIFQPMGMAGGGPVPRSTNIAGQPHMLSYITPGEANVLQAMGGSGAPGPGGIPSFFFDFDEGGVSGRGADDVDSGTTNFSSGGFESGDSGDNGGTTTGLNLTYADGTPAGVGIKGNVITGGTITGGSDPVAAGFGGFSSGVDDSAEFLGIPFSRPFARVTARRPFESGVMGTPEFGVSSGDTLSNMLSDRYDSMPTLSEAAVRGQYALGRGGFEPTAGPLSVPSSLSSPEGAYDYDVDLLGLDMDPQREMNLLQAEARAKDYTDRFGSAVVPEGFGSSRPTAPATPMVAEFARLNPANIERINRENLARDITSKGGRVDVNPETGEIVAVYDQSPVTLDTAPSPVPSPIAMPDAIREQRALFDVQSMQNPFDRGESAGEKVAQGQPSGQVEAPVGPFPESTYEIDGIAPRPGQSAAEVQAAINAARATGDSAFTRQSEIGRLADLMDRQTTVTLADPNNRPGRVDPNTGLPTNVDARSVSSLEQLGRRAGRGQTGIMGLIDKYTGFNPAEKMYGDIVEKGYSPVYDSRGQIIATVNPKTGQIGAGSRPIDMNAISETGGDLKAFIYNEFADQNLFGGGGGNIPELPVITQTPEEDEGEKAPPMIVLPPEDDPDDPAIPPVRIPNQPAEVGNPLQFGYGSFRPIEGINPNLDNAASEFLKLLGGAA